MSVYSLIGRLWMNVPSTPMGRAACTPHAIGPSASWEVHVQLPIWEAVGFHWMSGELFAPVTSQSQAARVWQRFLGG
jgi:hypothetical protein